MRKNAKIDAILINLLAEIGRLFPYTLVCHIYSQGDSKRIIRRAFTLGSAQDICRKKKKGHSFLDPDDAMHVIFSALT
jgi:hypothetical protein